MDRFIEALKLLDEIERIACGEDQVAENDGDGLQFIYEKIVNWKKEN